MTGKPGGGRREALGPQALRRRDRQLLANEGSVFDLGANLGVDQPPSGHGAKTPLGAYPDVAKVPRPDRLASLSRLSPKGEQGVQDQGRRRRGPTQGYKRAQGLDRGTGGRGKEHSRGMG